MDREYRYRLVEAMIQKTKELLAEDGDRNNYADIEYAVSHLESCRREVDILIHKLLTNELK